MNKWRLSGVNVPGVSEDKLRESKLVVTRSAFARRLEALAGAAKGSTGSNDVLRLP